MVDIAPWLVVCVSAALDSVSEFSVRHIARVLNLPSLPVGVSFSLAMELPHSILRTPDEPITCSVRRPNGEESAGYTAGQVRRATTPAGTEWIVLPLERVPFGTVGVHTISVHSAKDDRVLVSTQVVVRLVSTSDRSKEFR
jgi:hypothetical protein